MGRVRFSWSVGTAVVLGLCTSAAAQPVTHRLEVNRFVGTPFTESEADEILAEAGRVLTVDNDKAGPDDTACEVEFSRRGMIGTFMLTGVGVISLPGEFDTVLAQDGDAKVVNSISWCGKKPRIGLSFGGCSDGITFAVIATAEPLREAGVLWAHEFGHTRRLSLTANHPRPAPAVMATPVEEANRHVDEAECLAFRTRR